MAKVTAFDHGLDGVDSVVGKGIGNLGGWQRTEGRKGKKRRDGCIVALAPPSAAKLLAGSGRAVKFR
jgi:hypothetical protein